MLKQQRTKSAHSVQTDNACLKEKIELRKMATEHFYTLKVLDLFAGDNVLWSNFDKERYYGCESMKGKGKNLYADNRKVIPSLDLSDFNVIDLDSYGIPFEQVEQLFDNDTLKSGTVVVYTCIGNAMSNLSKKARKKFQIDDMYREAPTLFNGFGTEYFHSLLYDKGVREITVYRPISITFNKEYGFFIVP